MNVKIKKLSENAVIPSYAKEGDAGLDLTCIEVQYTVVAGMQKVRYKTGLGLEIPAGYVGLLFPRSSVYKKALTLTNSVGVIDSGYRGEIMMVFDVGEGPVYTKGDRIGQLIIMPYPQITFVETDTLSDTERGNTGYGSSGK